MKPSRHALEVMQGEQDTRQANQVRTSRFAVRQLAPGFDFQVAPGAARLTGLVQPVELGLNTASELAAAFAPATGGEESCAARPVPFQPEEEAGTLGVAAEPVQTEFNGGSFAETCTYQNGHFGGCGSCRDRANAADPDPKQSFPAAWLLACY